VDDPFGEFTDLVSFNQYIGWYDGLPDKTARISWSIKYPSRWSSANSARMRCKAGTPMRSRRFSEEYQEDLYRKTIAMLRKIPAWRGVTPWDPRRLPLPAPGSAQRTRRLESQRPDRPERQEEEAFAFLKAFYDESRAASRSGQVRTAGNMRGGERVAKIG